MPGVHPGKFEAADIVDAAGSVVDVELVPLRARTGLKCEFRIGRRSFQGRPLTLEGRSRARIVRIVVYFMIL